MKKYAVDMATKHHRLLKEGEPPLPNEKLVVTNNKGWIEVSPNEVIAPVAGRFEAKRRDNIIIQGNSNIRWGRLDKNNDIVAYRPLPVPEKRNWNGPDDGLPPIGTRCGVTQNDLLGEITHHTRNKKAAIIEYDNGNWDGFGPGAFRPLPSERERWIDEASHIIHTEYNNSPVQIAAAIYDAGLAPRPEDK